MGYSLMAEVVDFKEAQIKKQQHGTGEAFCLQCKHEWIAVVPTGVDHFECPECHTHKGVLRYEYMPKIVRECNCGNRLFYLTPDGHMCPNCGNYQEYD